MTVPAAGAPMRAARGAGFAATALGLGVGAHGVGGGALPSVGALVFLAVPVVWMSFFLTRARRRWPTIIASLLAVETGLHAGLSTLSGSMSDASTPLASGGQLAMDSHAGVLGSTAGMTPAAHVMAETPMDLGFTMVAAHLVATVLTGAALAYGEHLLWSLWTWLHHAVTTPPAQIQLPVRGALAPRWLLTMNPLPAPVNRSVRRRGPPFSRVGLPAST